MDKMSHLFFYYSFITYLAPSCNLLSPDISPSLLFIMFLFMCSLALVEHEWLHTTCYCSYHKDPIIILISETLSYAPSHVLLLLSDYILLVPLSPLVKYLGSHHYLWELTCFPLHTYHAMPQRYFSASLVILSYLCLSPGLLLFNSTSYFSSLPNTKGVHSLMYLTE